MDRLSSARLLRWGLAAAVFVGVATLPRPGGADCGDPDTLPLWTYPADGDEDVPIDADLLMVPAKAGHRLAMQLDGQPLLTRGTSPLSHDLGKLTADAKHTITITILDPGETDSSAGVASMTIRFRTGNQAQRTSRLSKGAITGMRPADRGDYEGLCRRLLERSYCADETAEAWELVVDVVPPPMLWEVTMVGPVGIGWSKRWPGTCGYPAWLTQYDPSGTYVVNAAHATGEPISTLEYREPPEDGGAQREAGVAPPSTGGALDTQDAAAPVADAGDEGTAEGGSQPDAAGGPASAHAESAGCGKGCRAGTGAQPIAMLAFLGLAAVALFRRGTRP